ncbi:AAA domain-containing protein [Hymenobacter actinosclerus]|uniref:AAA domain-containing protein n=1 Tax=Hymenobacter actinosclerus TaxID=82805 RepID=A0A1I0BM05_9BACT|nr:AAA domain-containing protein [Hymenobacter actinosclerus]
MPAQPHTPPPAYFLSLSLENVRSFGDKQTISFARPDGRPAQWTIILGDNGVGKTTVLKALAGMVAEKSFDEEMVDDKKIPKPALISLANTLWYPFRHGGETGLTLSIDICVIMPTGELFSMDQFRQINMTTKGQPNPGEMGYGGIFKKRPGINHQEPICYGYGAGRTVGNSTLGEVSQLNKNYISLFDDRADLLNPEEWFLQMEYSSLKQDKQAGKALKQVRQVLLQVLPDITDIRISSKGHQQFLELESPYGWVRLRDMSLGYQTLVVWLTDFASKLFIRYPDSPNPLEEPAIVLIDEIDLHLHPSWQRKLLDFLSDIFKNTQFIATAHSPLVVQAAGDQGANVVLLRREGDQTVVVTDVEDVRGWRVDQILNSELFEDVSTLSKQTEEDLARRNELLLKEQLTPTEEAKLAELNAKVAEAPIGDTPPERRVESLLTRLARNLKDDDLLH